MGQRLTHSQIKWEVCDIEQEVLLKLLSHNPYNEDIGLNKV